MSKAKKAKLNDVPSMITILRYKVMSILLRTDFKIQVIDGKDF